MILAKYCLIANLVILLIATYTYVSNAVFPAIRPYNALPFLLTFGLIYATTRYFLGEIQKHNKAEGRIFLARPQVDYVV